MEVRFFSQDKNYILKKAQSDLRDELCYQTVKNSLIKFEHLENPLGIMDDLIVALRKSDIQSITFLYPAYELLSGYYRMTGANNQLEFIWDGRSHEEKYRDEWTAAWNKWMTILSDHAFFNRAVVKACILFPNDPHQFLAYPINRLIYQQFNFKRNTKGYLEKVA